MKAAVIGLLAETSIHPGVGRSTWIVDLPVAREAATDYPVIPGSSLKGALLDKARGLNGTIRTEEVFGTQNAAGTLLISDGRLLLLPVRCLTGTYRWITCPHVIERYCRDLRRAGLGPVPQVPQVKSMEALAFDDRWLYLEEREFKVTGAPDASLIEAIKPVIAHKETRQRLMRQLAVLSDDDFTWFARYGLSIQARNQLEKDTKTSKNLWYEESIPPDAVMYALVTERKDGALDVLDQLFSPDRPYLQAGGNETVGQGWFAVTVRRSGNPERGDDQ